MARPSKLTDNVIKILREILQDDSLILAYTDADILDELNDRLTPDERITRKTFENWQSEKNIEFFTLIKKARDRTKRNLINKMQSEKQGWQRFAWLLERRFSDQFKERKETEIQGSITINLKF